MADYSDRIKPTDYSISTFLETLQNKNYQIPTFQREVVWERDSVKKLWDSIYRFYPIGSILIWKTNLKLQNHRTIGGHIITDNGDRSEFQYILDGQQRTTSLLTSLYGGTIEGKDGFNPTLYIERYPTYKDPFRDRLRIMHNVLGNYRLSFIELKGIEVSEVCQIFERINQAGKPLDIFDIVVAKTFRLEKPEINQSGFYLRELVDNFRSDTPGNFSGLDDLTYLQVLAMVINTNISENDILNITPVYLNRMRTEQIEAVWDKTAKAMRKLFDFFDNHLHLKGPRLIPYRYFYITLATYFYDNPKPDYEAIKKYFWYFSFHAEDLLTNTTHLRRHIELLAKLRKGEGLQLERFLINRNRMRTVYYSAAGRYATAMLALFANHEPRDWEQLDRHVLNDVYYALTDKPNLHHTFPVNYIREHPGENRLHVDCMANIVYLTQLTNIRISDENPMLYLRDFDKPGFEKVLEGHLVPLDVLAWSRHATMPENALDTFLEKRIDLIIDALRTKLDGIQFDVVDTREAELSL